MVKTRILLTIEYDGSAYAGWQRQKNALAIQQVLEEAVSKLQGQKTVLHGSGRTDAGVHALGQCAHFDCICTIPPEKWTFVLNNILPDDIRIRKSREVAADFHARYWACDKTYQYIIYNCQVASAIKRHQTGFVPYPLDRTAMEQALPSLLGTHDFAAFMATHGGQEDTVRTIYAASLEKRGDTFLFYIRGNGFLRNMVRIIVGTLIDIGRGRLQPNVFTQAYERKDRQLLGDTAPASGLYLQQVRYDSYWEEKILDNVDQNG